MIYFTMFLLGGIFGIALWFYLSGFITRLQQEIYATYIELFPQNRSPFQPHFASIQQKKCGHILRYFLSVGVGFIFLQIAFKDSIFTVWFGLTLLILWAISYLDWHYQLISTTPCLWLLTIGLFGADNNFSLLTLSESIKSAASFFYCFLHNLLDCKILLRQRSLWTGRLLASNGIRKFYSFRNLTALFIISLSSWNMFFAYS